LSVPLGSGERILLVDDEEAIAMLFEIMLTRLGYAAETRTRVAEALDMVRANPDRFDLVITDMTMPVMSGLDFARRLAEIRPNLPVILTTGYPGGLQLDKVRSMGIRELVVKPPSMQSLGTAIRSVLAGANMSA
jgi:CheY-like chemotaxis protein